MHPYQGAPFFWVFLHFSTHVMVSKNRDILLSTAYLPPVIYFAHIVHARSVYLEKKETYIKQTYRNRCEIYSANGKLRLSIPVIRVNGNHTRTDDILISHKENWPRSHWRALESAYNSSPYFLYYKDALAPFFNHRYTSLFEYNTGLLNTILELLDLYSEIRFTETYSQTDDDIVDLRNKISPDISVSKDHFPEYQQVFSEKSGFLPNLSILDLLFNEGPGALEYLNSVKREA